MMRATSKNSVPCASHAKPCGRLSAFFFETPAMEKGWQGKPASRTSCVRDVPPPSPRGCRRRSGARRRENSRGRSSGCSGPTRMCRCIRRRCVSKPRRSPPMPANRSMKVKADGFSSSVSNRSDRNRSPVYRPRNPSRSRNLESSFMAVPSCSPRKLSHIFARGTRPEHSLANLWRNQKAGAPPTPPRRTARPPPARRTRSGSRPFPPSSPRKGGPCGPW